MDKPILEGLWRDQPETREGKYLLLRRDGTIPEWPSFTLGARDPAAPAALRAYALAAQEAGMNAGYCLAVYNLSEEFEEYRKEHGAGDPEAGRHRIDDPEVISKMKLGKSV